MSDREREFQSLREWVASWPRPKLDYGQMPVPDLLSLRFYCRLLTHQACYMLLLRTFAVLYREGLVADEVQRDGGLSLARIVQWSRDLKPRTLSEAYCTYPHPPLVGLVADLKIEEQFLAAEEARRLQDKPLTCEFIRLDWTGENRSKEIARLLRVNKIRSRRPWEQDSADIRQAAWLKAWELWRQPGNAPENTFSLPAFPFPAEEVLPDEREFWEGPMARGWKIGLKAALQESIPIFTGEKETIPGKVRDSLRNEWETISRRQTILAGQEEFPRDPREEAVRADWDWSDYAAKSRREEITAQVHPSVGSDDPLAGLEAERLYRKAQKRYGKKARKFFEAWGGGHTQEEAAAIAGISRTTANKYLKLLSELSS